MGSVCGPWVLFSPLCVLWQMGRPHCACPRERAAVSAAGSVPAGLHSSSCAPLRPPVWPEPASVQRQLYRAVLIKVSDRWGHNTSNGNRTAACKLHRWCWHLSGVMSHFLSLLFASNPLMFLQSSIMLLYCTTKHHNLVFMSIFHPPSDPSTAVVLLYL